jgi:hypothetical protein
MVKQILTIMALVSLGGCFKHTITMGKGGDMSKPPLEQKDYYFIYGAVGQSSVNVEQVCKSNNATVVVQETIVDGLIGNCVCGNLLMPQTTQIYCGAQSSGGEPAASGGGPVGY